jgi:membrane protein
MGWRPSSSSQAFATHLWLPDARPRVWNVLPGIAATLVLWLLGASLYGEFLANMTHLKATYAGLAGILTALIFLQISAAIFIFGAELNAALRRRADPVDNGVPAIVKAAPAPQLQA